MLISTASLGMDGVLHASQHKSAPEKGAVSMKKTTLTVVCRGGVSEETVRACYVVQNW